MLWKSYHDTFSDVLGQINPVQVYALCGCLYAAREQGATVFTCGNGGSAANASHLAQDLSKGTRAGFKGQPLRAISLCENVGAITAWANDVDYTAIFAEQLSRLATAGDVLIAISGSGKSENVLAAVWLANHRNLHTWGITGFDGGRLSELAHRCVHVPCDDMGMVEAAHSVVFHWVVNELRERFAGDRRRPSVMDGANDPASYQATGSPSRFDSGIS